MCQIILLKLNLCYFFQFFLFQFVGKQEIPRFLKMLYITFLCSSHDLKLDG